MSPSEPNGIALSRAYYDEIVRPLLTERFGDLPHSAGRLGAGSDVLGLDDETSRDHDWGLRLSVFVPEAAVDAVDAELERALPAAFRSHPTRFAFTGSHDVRHHVEVGTLSSFLDARLDFDPRNGPTVTEWLSLSGQAALEVTAGPVFADETGELTRAREALGWYPSDVWRYVVACDWARLAQELPLMARAAQVGDETGSRVIAARLAQVAMHLTFMLERRWAPYAKWFGTVFGTLAPASSVGAALDRTLRADAWQERQQGLAEALEALLSVQNAAGLTATDRATVPFWNRDAVRPNPAIVAELLDGILNPDVRSLPLGRGSIEQRTDNVDVLIDPRARRAAVAAQRDEVR